jgi:iron complex outermembrane recepter protein
MPTSGKGDTQDSVVTGKVGASYKFADNFNTYFSYTRGYKGAAYDIEVTANFAALKPLLPETVEAYELGVKWASLSGRFGANLAVYQSNFQNLQVETQQEVNGFLSFVVANTGAARAQGLELEFFARPLPGLSLTGGYAYSDTAFDLDGSICYQLQPVQILAPGTVPPGNTCYRYTTDGPMTQARKNIRDGVLISAPEHRFNMTARYEAPINDDYNWFAQTSVRYQSEVRFAVDQNPLSVEKPNAILDASVGIGRSNGRYQLSLFVKNLTNEFYSTGISIDQFVATPASPYELTHFVPKDAERFFGVNLRFEY